MSHSTSPSGAVVFLIEESSALGTVLAQSDAPKANVAATALNALLGQLADWPGLAVALLGYQAGADGSVNAGSRWAGSLAGRDWVMAGEFLAAPVRVENRNRKMPDGSERQISFPIWYEPHLGSKAPATAGFEAARELLQTWTTGDGASAAPPLLIHVLAGPSSDGDPDGPSAAIAQLRTAKGSTILCQLHLASATAAPTIAYPSNRAFLPAGQVRDLFDQSSLLPPPLVEGLRAAKQALQNNARSLVYNARATDVIRLFGLVKDYAKASAKWSEAEPTGAAATRTTGRLPPVPSSIKTTSRPSAPAQPAAAAPLPPAASVAEPAPAPVAAVAQPGADLMAAPSRLVVLVLDRSAEESSGDGAASVWSRLQERGNEMVASITKTADKFTAVAVCYGGDGAGNPDVRVGFDGPLDGRAFVPGTDLAEGALRIDAFEEQMSNGIGGLLNVTRKKAIYLERPQASGCSPVPAFAEVTRLLTEWEQQHPQAVRPALVLHCTRGKHNPEDLDQAIDLLQPNLGHDAVLYHLVLTESPQKSLAYPSSAGDLSDLMLRKLWEHSSPLLDREILKAAKPFLDSDSRGFVVNGKFDLLLAQ